MNNRERIGAVLRGEKPDRMPWIPRLDLWYRAHRKQNTLPERYRGMTIDEIERTLGCGAPARGGKVAARHYEDVEVVTLREGNFEVTEYGTPVGRVRSVMQFSDELSRLGLPGHVIEYPLKTPDDYAVWSFVVEHTHWTPTYEAFRQYDEKIGPDGLPMVPIGDVPYHQWARELAGYEHAFYHLADFPATVEALLAMITDIFRERLLPIVLDSPAELFLHGGHLSSQFAPPGLFAKYVLPHCREFFGRFHAAGKFLTMHADNDTSAILDLLAGAGWDLMECFATAPLVPVTLREALDAFAGDVAIWGGVPSTILEPGCPQGAFEAHVDDILAAAAGYDRFILGISDNLMPSGRIERIEYISRKLGLGGRSRIL